MIRKKIIRIPRSPNVSSGIRVEGGGTANQEILASGESYPDRTLTPLVLQPFVSYTDATTGKSVENALPELISGCWYRLTSANRSLGLCESTKISTSITGTDSNGSQISVFEIVSTPGSSAYGRLTVRENVPVGEEITYVFEAVLSSGGRKVREYFNSRCSQITEIPDIEFDNNPTALFNPLEDPQYFTIIPSLTIDYPVVWKWMSYHELENGWVALGSTLLDWAVERSGSGVKIDRNRMPDNILLRCIAEVTVDGVTVTIEKVVTHTRMMPAFKCESICIGELPEDVDTISPRALIKCGDTVIADESELSVDWLNSSGVAVAHGINPTFPISALNADGIYDLRVRDKGGFSALYDSSDNTLLTDGDCLLITRSKV